MCKSHLPVNGVACSCSSGIRPPSNLARVRYPEIQRTTNAEAAFAFAFVLDTTGKAEYSTISFIGIVGSP